MAIYPYIHSSGHVVSVIEKLRNRFPDTVDLRYLKVHSIAPKNENLVIKTLKFIGLIDENGNKALQNSKILLRQKDEEFEKGFEEIIKKAYVKLFDAHGDDAWNLDDDALVTFFREIDDRDENIGKKQCKLFQTLSALSGKRDFPATRNRGNTISRISKPNSKISTPPTPEDNRNLPLTDEKPQIPTGIGMSVKIEINIPSDGSSETYDAIFGSIRKHLINTNQNSE